MENLTLGDVGKTLAFIVAFLSSIVYLKQVLINSINKTLVPIDKKIDSIELNYIRSYLVNFMCQVENEKVSNEQIINAYDLYDRYCDMGGNSYVHDKWEKLKKEGKL